MTKPIGSAVRTVGIACDEVWDHVRDES